ncbi:MAG: TrkH family potassium uptake protein [Planctomycetota bacterium]
MHYRYVIRQLALLLLVLSGAMGAALVYELLLIYRITEGSGETRAAHSLAISTAIGAVLGGAIYLVTRARPGETATFGRREAMLLVGTSWMLGAALASLPYYLWGNLPGSDPGHAFHSFTGCYFEAMSGLTTTGATVLGADHSRIGDLPKGLLLWRSATHWLGGLGIVVLFVAVLPTVGAVGKKMFQVESTADQGGVRPKIAETARVLWLIYLGLTLLCILMLMATGTMSLFDAVNHAFSVMATGGLSTRDASIGGYDSVAVDIILTCFMILAGINFVLYFHVLQRRWKPMLQDVELRIYLVLKVVVSLVIAFNLMGGTITTTAGLEKEAGFFTALRYASFQTASMQTGTGFGTADYDLWPMLSIGLLVPLMIMGGCAGSTAGGLKVIRLWIMIKVMWSALERAFRPNVVRPIKIGKMVIDDDLKLSAMTYFVLIIVGISAGTFLTLLFESYSQCDFQTAFSASLASLCNVGPGQHHVGPTQNYGWMSAPSLWTQAILMALGRLEIYALLVLLLPRFWSGK